jgi:hypothetical protein
MSEESGTANETATADLSGGFNNLKETVYNFLENLFSWMSTHQGLALIIVIGVLGILIWFILRARKHGKQLEKQVSSKDIAIGKKDTLIEEQKNKLAALERKMSDQRGFIGEALLGTLMNLTGYDINQLKIFFKFLTEISGNPLQIADAQANTVPGSQRLEEESDDSTKGNEKAIAPDSGPEEVVEAKKTGEE